jgi:hypothetical protein
VTSIVIAMIVILVVVACTAGLVLSGLRAAARSAHPSWPTEWRVLPSISTVMGNLPLASSS